MKYFRLIGPKPESVKFDARNPESEIGKKIKIGYALVPGSLIRSPDLLLDDSLMDPSYPSQLSLTMVRHVPV